VSGAVVRAEAFLLPGPRVSGSYISAVERSSPPPGGDRGRFRRRRFGRARGVHRLARRMSAAKGFCSVGVPLVPCDPARPCPSISGRGTDRLSVQDARRGEVYAALFRWNGGELARLSPDMAFAPALLPGRIPDGDVLFCGDGVTPFGALFREALGDRAILVSGDEGLPRASAVGIVGERIFRDVGAGDPRTAVPFYLRFLGTEFPVPRP